MKNKLAKKSIIIFAVVLIAGILIFIRVTKANILTGLLNKIFPSVSNEIEEVAIPAVDSYEAVDIHEENIIKAIEKAEPSVVSIIITKDLPVVEQCPFNPFSDLPQEFQQFFGDMNGFTQPCQTGTKKQEVGGGTGFVISQDGMILTNKHVVSDTKAEYTVLMNNGKKYPAKILATDPVQDIAIAKISVTGLKPLKLGDSDSIKLGQTAIAIGNALGEFRNTVTSGIISGLARKITAATNLSGGVELLEGLIQTDAAINSGNSGGPLLNLRGEVIGINVAVASGAQSIGFAIPINKAKKDIDSVKSTGKISASYLGVRYSMITEEMAKQNNLSVTYGALVRGSSDGAAVVKDSPAYKAGVQAEDIILEINGRKLDQNNSLGAVLQRYNVGEKISLKILRNDKEITVTVTLGERPVE
ncbi:MAG: trypsin-like peptidase domain-containing protein [Candidatus Pacebacteria bacterium]|nr:trypsin-like peptidase domain-containing protein [Candidatus Paceibacterota bacterium]